ncbi:MAG: CBS domain-containing protein [Polyangiales bacterium]
MIAADLMTENPITLHDDQTISEAWRTLASTDVRHLPVVNEEGDLVGMLSDRDLARLRDERLQDSRKPISDIMSTPSIAVTSDTEVSEVIDQLLDNRIGALPVVDVDSKVIGIVSYVDVLRAYRLEVES